MNDKLIKIFQKYLDKQDYLRKLTETEKLHEFGYSEVHTIAAIGDLEEPNVTNLAKMLNMTRGGISKIVKRLIAAGLITPEQRGENRQKIFYNLTEKGKLLYEEHAKTHALWVKRDNEFLSRFSDEQIAFISDFMQKFNEYLDKQISQSVTNQKEV